MALGQELPEASSAGPELKTTLAEHAAGNLRVLSTMANELLALAARRELTQIDQKLYLETFASQPRPRLKAPVAAERAKA